MGRERGEGGGAFKGGAHKEQNADAVYHEELFWRVGSRDTEESQGDEEGGRGAQGFNCALTSFGATVLRRQRRP